MEAPTPDSHALRFGPYRAPRVHRGEKLFCEVRGTVIVGGYSDASIPWPRMRRRGGRPCLILCADLVRAVKQEALIAVAHHWGVSETTVWKWRTALGVERWNAGSTELIREWAAVRDDDRLERAREASHQPTAVAGISYPTLWNLEVGRGLGLSQARARRLAAALDVDLSPIARA